MVVVTLLGQKYNVGEKPTVILYTYINRHAGTPEKQQKKQNNVVVCMYVCMYVWSSHTAEYGSTG